MEKVFDTEVKKEILAKYGGDESKITIDDYAAILESYKDIFYEVNEYGRYFGATHIPGPSPCYNTAITRDSIKHMVDAAGDLNPLYRDPEYAKTTKYGTLIAPPFWTFSITNGCYVPYAAPQFFNLYASDRIEWYLPAADGDKSDYKSTLPIRVERKETKKGGSAVRVTGLNEFKRVQGGIPLARHEFDLMCIQIQTSPFKTAQSGADMPEYTEEYIESVHAAQDNEKVWGGTPHYWEDVTIGETLPPVVRGPYSSMEIATWWTACGQWYMCSDRIGRFIHDESGWGYYHPKLKTWLNFHENVFDAFGELSRQTGSYAPSGNGAQRAGWAMMMLSNWISDEGFLWKFNTRNVRKGGYWNVFWTKGTVIDKGVDEARRNWVKIKLETTDQNDEVILAGDATVLLPSRERGGVIYPTPEHYMGKF